MAEEDTLPITTSWEAISFDADFVRKHELGKFPWAELSFNPRRTFITITFLKDNRPDARAFRLTKLGNGIIRDPGFANVSFGISEWQDKVLYRAFRPRQLKASGDRRQFRIQLSSGVELH